MSTQHLFDLLIEGLKATTIPEYVAVFTGIISVWFSKKENVLVFPVGLINTTIFIWLNFKFHLLGEASVNLYYTAMSIYGWYLWTRKDVHRQTILRIAFSTPREWRHQLLFFSVFYIAIFAALWYLKQGFFPGAIPWADALASACAFTGMWLMAKKKVESWGWWIATNISSIPLYFVKGLIFTSLYYFVLLILAIGGLVEWRRKALININK